MRALVAIVLAGCTRSPDVTRFPNTAPRTFCAALAAYDYKTASWAIATKLDSIGGLGDAASEQLVRAWLYTQPCIVTLDRDPCEPSNDRDIEAEVTTGRIQVRLLRAGGAFVSESRACDRVPSRRVITFEFL